MAAVATGAPHGAPRGGGGAANAPRRCFPLAFFPIATEGGGAPGHARAPRGMHAPRPRRAAPPTRRHNKGENCGARPARQNLVGAERLDQPTCESPRHPLLRRSPWRRRVPFALRAAPGHLAGASAAGLRGPSWPASRAARGDTARVPTARSGARPDARPPRAVPSPAWSVFPGKTEAPCGPRAPPTRCPASRAPPRASVDRGARRPSRTRPPNARRRDEPPAPAPRAGGLEPSPPRPARRR